MTIAELSKPLPAPIPRDKFRLVDADAHIDPPHTFWADYLPENLKHMAPTIEEGDECDFVVFEGRKRPLIMLANQAGRAGKDFKIMGKLADLHDSATPDKRLKVMDEDGVDVEILYGGGPLGTGNSANSISRAIAPITAGLPTSATMTRTASPVLPICRCAMSTRSIQLMREAVKLGHRSINIPAFPQSMEKIDAQLAQGAALTGDPNSEKAYWHPEFDPLLGRSAGT